MELHLTPNFDVESAKLSYCILKIIQNLLLAFEIIKLHFEKNKVIKLHCEKVKSV